MRKAKGQRINQVLGLHSQGRSKKEIGEILQLTKPTVSKCLSAGGVKTGYNISDGAFIGFNKGHTYCYDCAEDCEHYKKEYCTLLKDTRFVDKEGMRDICKSYESRKDLPKKHLLKERKQKNPNVMMYKGKELTIAELAEISGYAVSTVRKYLQDETQSAVSIIIKGKARQFRHEQAKGKKIC